MCAARLSLLISLAIASGAVALSGCGAADQARNAVDPVAQAADVTQNSGTAAVTFRGRVVARGKTVPIDGHGVIDTRNGSRAQLSFRFAPNGKSVEMDEILAGKTLYIGGKAFQGQLPHGKSWAKLDLERLAAKAGIDTSSLDGGGSSTSEMLRYLRGAGSVRKQGSENVAGASTTHYHAVVDTAKLAAERGDANFAASMRKLRTQIQGPMTLDVWIDSAHRVRQETVDYTTAVNGQRVRSAFTTRFTGFGVPMKLDTPPKDDVRDVTDEVLRQVHRGSP
jgi:hypothetical protein